MLLNSIPNTVFSTEYSTDWPFLSDSFGLGGFFPVNGQTLTGQDMNNNRLLVSNNGEFYISILSEPPTNQFSSPGRAWCLGLSWLFCHVI